MTVINPDTSIITLLANYLNSTVQVQSKRVDWEIWYNYMLSASKLLKIQWYISETKYEKHSNSQKEAGEAI